MLFIRGASFYVQKAMFLLIWAGCMIPAFGQLQPAADSLKSTDFQIQKHSKQRLRQVTGGTAAVYAGGMTGLGLVWYDDFPARRFRFFDDAPQWQQLDKAGHVYAAWHLARTQATALQWAGISRQKAAWWAGSISFMMQSSIEIFDGFSPAYGASWSDLAANATGAAAAAWQYASYNEEKVFLKFSFHTTALASRRPHTLGSNLPEQILKDYNGQTYWLSTGLQTMGCKRCPGWLAVSAGYGADGMLYGRNASNRQAGFQAYRQFLSLARHQLAGHTDPSSPASQVFLYNKYDQNSGSCTSI